MELRLSGGGRFGDRALWAGIAGAADEGGDDGRDADAGGEGRLPGVESLRRLAATAAAAGRRAGLEMEEPRRYRPHLTLARARPSAGRPVDLRPYVALLESLRGERWTAGELALVRSKLPDSGIPGEQPRYEQIAAWPLDG